MVEDILTKEHFRAILASHTYVIVEFTANWCPACKAITPLYNQLSNTHTIQSELAFIKVNVDTVIDMASEYNITAMPTFMSFKHGAQVAVAGHQVLQGAKVIQLMSIADKLGRLARARVKSRKDVEISPT